MPDRIVLPCWNIKCFCAKVSDRHVLGVAWRHLHRVLHCMPSRLLLSVGGHGDADGLPCRKVLPRGLCHVRGLPQRQCVHTGRDGASQLQCRLVLQPKFVRSDLLLPTQLLSAGNQLVSVEDVSRWLILEHTASSELGVMRHLPRRILLRGLRYVPIPLSWGNVLPCQRVCFHHMPRRFFLPALQRRSVKLHRRLLLPVVDVFPDHLSCRLRLSCWRVRVQCVPRRYVLEPNRWPQQFDMCNVPGRQLLPKRRHGRAHRLPRHVLLPGGCYGHAVVSKLSVGQRQCDAVRGRLLLSELARLRAGWRQFPSARQPYCLSVWLLLPLRRDCSDSVPRRSVLPKHNEPAIAVSRRLVQQRHRPKQFERVSVVPGWCVLSHRHRLTHPMHGRLLLSNRQRDSSGLPRRLLLRSRLRHAAALRGWLLLPGRHHDADRVSCRSVLPYRQQQSDALRFRHVSTAAERLGRVVLSQLHRRIVLPAGLGCANVLPARLLLPCTLCIPDCLRRRLLLRCGQLLAVPLPCWLLLLCSRNSPRALPSRQLLPSRHFGHKHNRVPIRYVFCSCRS
jgi:hypothetical protein